MAVGTFLSIVAYRAKKGAGGGGDVWNREGNKNLLNHPIRRRSIVTMRHCPQTEIYDIDVGGRLRKCKELETVSALG